MNKMIFKLFAVASLLISTMTNAALITETWTGTIVRTSLDNSLIGSTFDVVLTYDNASTSASQYWDGDNKIAEFGMGDDTIAYTYCTDSAPMTTSCDARYSDHAFISQAQFNVDEIMVLFRDYNPIALDEATDTNQSTLHEQNDIKSANFNADHFRWRARLDGGEYVTSFSHDGTGPDIVFGEIAKTFVATYALNVTEVATPSTLGLIVIFSATLSFLRLRRRMHY